MGTNTKWLIEDPSQQWTIEDSSQQWTIDDPSWHDEIRKGFAASKAPTKKQGFVDTIKSIFDSERGTVPVMPSVPLAGIPATAFSTDPKAATHAVTQMPRGVVERIPFAGSLAEFTRYANLYRAARAVEHNQASDNDYKLLQDFARELERDKNLEKTWGGQVAEVVSHLPTFAAEFAATGGAYSGAKNIVQKALGKAAAKKLIKYVPSVVGAMAQTAAMPTRIAATGAEKAVEKDVAPRVAGAAAAGGDWKEQLRKAMTDMNDGFAEALLKAYPDTFVEVASERAGGVVEKLMPQRVKALKAAVAKWWKDKGGRPVELLQKIKQKSGWNGVLGEMFEERVAEVMHEANQRSGIEQKIGEDSPAMVKFVTGQGGRAAALKEFVKQLSVEGAAFSMPGTAARAIEYSLNKIRRGESVASEIEQGLNSKHLNLESLNAISLIIAQAPESALSMEDKIRLQRIANRKARAFKPDGPLVSSSKTQPATQTQPPTPTTSQEPAKTIRQQLHVPTQSVIPSPEAAGPSQPLPAMPIPEGKPQPTMTPAAAPVPYEEAIQQPKPAQAQALPIYPSAPPSEPMQVPQTRKLPSAADIIYGPSAPPIPYEEAIQQPTPAVNPTLPVYPPAPAFDPAQQPIASPKYVSWSPEERIRPRQETPFKLVWPRSPVGPKDGLLSDGTRIPAYKAYNEPHPEPKAQAEAQVPDTFMLGDRVKTTKGKGVIVGVGKGRYDVRIKDVIVTLQAEHVQPLPKPGPPKLDPEKSLENAVINAGGINPEIVRASGLWGEWERIPLARRRRITRKNSKAPIEETAALVASYGYQVDGSNLLYELADDVSAKRGVSRDDYGTPEAQLEEAEALIRRQQRELDDLREEYERLMSRQAPTYTTESGSGDAALSEDEWEEILRQSPEVVGEQKSLYGPEPFTLSGGKVEKKTISHKLTPQEMQRQFEAEKARRTARQGSLIPEEGTLFSGAKGQPGVGGIKTDQQRVEPVETTGRQQRQAKQDIGRGLSWEEKSDAQKRAYEKQNKLEWHEAIERTQPNARRHSVSETAFEHWLDSVAPKEDVKNAIAGWISSIDQTELWLERILPESLKEYAPYYHSVETRFEQGATTEEMRDWAIKRAKEIRDEVTSPFTVEQIDKELRKTHTHGSDKLLDDAKKNGATDEQILRIIQQDYGASGAYGTPEETEPDAEYHGGSTPMISLMKGKPTNVKQKVTLKGNDLIKAYRRANHIPYPKEKDGLFAEPEPTQKAESEKAESQTAKSEKMDIGASAADLKPVETAANDTAQIEVDRRAEFVRSSVDRVLNGSGDWSVKRKALGLPTRYKWDSRSIDKVPVYDNLPIVESEIRKVINRELADTIAQTGMQPTLLGQMEQPKQQQKTQKKSLFDQITEGGSDYSLDIDLADVVSETHEGPKKTDKQLIKYIQVADPLPESGGNLAGSAGANEASLLGLAITPAFKTGSWIDVRGKRIRNKRDVVAVGRLFRNAQFEVFHTIYVKDGRIVRHEAVSSRMPRVSKIFAKDTPQEGIRQIGERIKKLGADKVYFFHNHPSGDVKTSDDDRWATKALCDAIPEAAGQIIINHTTYSWIDQTGTATEYLMLPNKAPDLIHEPSVPHQGLGVSVYNYEQVAAWGKAYVQPAATNVTIVYRSKNPRTGYGVVRAIESVPLKIFMNPPEFRKWVIERAAEFGGHEAFAFYNYAKSFDLSRIVWEQMRKYSIDGLLLDGVVEGIKGSMFYGNPKLPFGLSDDELRNRTIQVLEDSAKYGSVANAKPRGVLSVLGDIYEQGTARAESKRGRRATGSDSRGDGRSIAEAAHLQADIDSASRSQTIRTVADAERWLRVRGLKPEGKYSPSEAIARLQAHPDFDNLSVDDKVRLHAQLQRVPRERTYADTQIAKGNVYKRENAKSSGRLGQPQTVKAAGSGILTEDTVLGCTRGCLECYGLGMTNRTRISYQSPARAVLTGVVKDGQILRIGVRGDPSQDWAHSAEQVRAKIERSRAAGYDVDFEHNVMVITNAHSLDGYDPEVFPNLEITLDPQQFAHMQTAMVNTLRIKAAHPGVNIAVRIRTVASHDPQIMRRQEYARDFARRFGIKYLETRMRFFGKSAFVTLSLDKTQYHHPEGNHLFKVNTPQLYDRSDPLAELCDRTDDNCPGCKTCRRIMIDERERNIQRFTDGMKANGIVTSSFRGVKRDDEDTGGAPGTMLRERGTPYLHGSPHTFDKFSTEKNGEDVAVKEQYNWYGDHPQTKEEERLSARQKQLASEIDHLYQTGQTKKAESLEYELENLIARSEEIAAEDYEAPTESNGVSIEEQLAARYRDLINPRQTMYSRDELIAQMRGVLEDAQRGGMSPSGLRADITDAEIIDAARDAYERLADLKDRYRRGAPTDITALRSKYPAIMEDPAAYDRKHNAFADHPTWEQRYQELVARNKAERKRPSRWYPLSGESDVPGGEKYPTLFWRSPNNVLDRMGGKYAEIAKLITEAARAKKASQLPGHTYGMQHYDDIANDIIKESGIKRGSDEDQMVVDLLDSAFTGLTPEELRRSPAYRGDKEAAIRAAERFRNEIFEPIISHIRGDQELVGIIGKRGYIRGYFPHWWEQLTKKYSQKGAAAIARALMPERFVSRFLKERESNNWLGTVSIYDAVPSYIASTMKTIHDIPAYDKARAIAESLEDGTLKNYAMWYIQNYMGVKASSGGIAEFDADSRMMKLSRKVAQLYYDNLIGLNPITWGVNLMQTISNTIPEVGIMHTLHAVKKLFGSKEARRKFHESGILLDFPGMESGILAEGKIRKLMHGGMAAAEYINRGIAYLAGLEQAKSRGLVGKAAEMHAMDIVDTTQFAYAAEGQSEILSKLPPDMRVFQTFKLKEAEYVRNLIADAWQEQQEGSGSKAARAKLGRYLAINTGLPFLLQLAGVPVGRMFVELWDLFPSMPRTLQLAFQRALPWSRAAWRGLQKDVFGTEYPKGTRIVNPEDIPADLVTGLYDAFGPAANIGKKVARWTGVTK
jgi:hypothetical protein